MNTDKITARNALARLREHFGDDEDTAEFLYHFCDEADEIATPFTRSLVVDIVRIMPGIVPWETSDLEFTVLHETLTKIDPEFANTFADVNELCREHSCDPEICSDQH